MLQIDSDFSEHAIPATDALLHDYLRNLVFVKLKVQEIPSK